MTSSRKLDSKKENLLKLIVKEYVQTAVPVASLGLGQHYGLDSSPATLRNWMSDLEEQGFLEQPHASSGRIPTDYGYRHYVDLLMEKKDLTSRDRRFITRELEAGFREIEDLLHEAGKIISQIGHVAALILSPAANPLVLESLQLVRVGKEKVLLVLLTRSGLVLDRIVEMEITKEHLEEVSRLLNHRLRGTPLLRINPRLMEDLADQMIHELLRRILELIEETVEIENKNRIFLEGMDRLLEHPEFQDLGRFKSALEAMRNQERLSRFLGKAGASPDASVYIGNENPVKGLQAFSVIAVPYTAGNISVGTLALVGPTRMNYDRLIPLLEFTSAALSERLLRLLA